MSIRQIERYLVKDENETIRQKLDLFTIIINKVTAIEYKVVGSSMVGDTLKTLLASGKVVVNGSSGSGSTGGTVLTGVQIKALYEGNTDTNVFSDSDKSTLASALQTPVDISNLVSKVAGKQLSTEDYTTAEKTKLAGLSGSHFKGTHADEAILLLAHPTAEPGSYAYVMDAHNHEQMYVWDDTNSLWENLGHTSAVHMTDAQIKTQYENNPDTNALTDSDLAKIGTALQTHQSLAGLIVVTPGKDLSTNDYTTVEKTKLGTVPDMPTGDGEYVLTVVGGVSTWGLNSGGATVYDAHILGSTLASDITLSPFVKHGGLDEETRNQGIDFADGGIYLIYPMYQAGVSAAHIGGTKPMFLADDYANASPVGLFNGAGTSMGNTFTGAQMNAAIAAGDILQVQYDSSSSKLLVEVT